MKEKKLKSECFAFLRALATNSLQKAQCSLLYYSKYCTVMLFKDHYALSLHMCV